MLTVSIHESIKKQIYISRIYVLVYVFHLSRVIFSEKPTRMQVLKAPMKG